jgi:hypothetical protein
MRKRRGQVYWGNRRPGKIEAAQYIHLPPFFHPSGRRRRTDALPTRLTARSLPFEPSPLSRPRDPRASGLWRVMERHIEAFRRVYDERFADRYGFWRPIVKRSVTAFLRCGDLHEGFARMRCPDCRHEMFVAFSCKQRCTSLIKFPITIFYHLSLQLLVDEIKFPITLTLHTPFSHFPFLIMSI